MIGSRAVNLLRAVARSPKTKQFLVQVRKSSDSHAEPHGGWVYRTHKKPQKWATRSATASAVLLWWWFYWNLWHGWPHLLGLYDGAPLKDPRTYTDEELGIPPDNE